ncbi:MAG: AAA family ATPase [Ignavibacteriae bacterium]|nr:AAA family ATPase [Ignavibacteriota bacterium]
MSGNRIIAVVGMCGSGKSEAVKYFTDKGFKKVYFGDVVISELKKRGLEINEKNERKIREELRAEYGMGVMAIKSIGRIKEYFRTDNVVIESMYSWEEFKIIKEAFGEDFKVLAIYTTKSLRYERLGRRDFRPLTNEEAMSRDLSEIQNLDKGGPIAYADYTLINDSTLEELKIKLGKLF